MRSGSAAPPVKSALGALGLCAALLAVVALLPQCSAEPPLPVTPDAAPWRPAVSAAPLLPSPQPVAPPSAPLVNAEPAPDAGATLEGALELAEANEPSALPGADAGTASDALEAGHCPGVPPLGPDGTPPPPAPHTPVGEDLEIPGDRPIYLLPGDPGDRRAIVYLHGMCGDVAAADFFRESARAHGTLLALRGDKQCSAERYKWRDDAPKIYQRLRVALERVRAQRGGVLDIDEVLLFGYSQGADRAERLVEHFPKQFPRVVLGGPPMRASAHRLARASAVAILGGELETTENMRAGADALAAAGIRTRYFTLECAYHGRYGTRAEQQLLEVLDWVRTP